LLLPFPPWAGLGTDVCPASQPVALRGNASLSLSPLGPDKATPCLPACGRRVGTSPSSLGPDRAAPCLHARGLTSRHPTFQPGPDRAAPSLLAWAGQGIAFPYHLGRTSRHLLFQPELDKATPCLHAWAGRVGTTPSCLGRTSQHLSFQLEAGRVGASSSRPGAGRVGVSPSRLGRAVVARSCASERRGEGWHEGRGAVPAGGGGDGSVASGVLSAGAARAAGADVRRARTSSGDVGGWSGEAWPKE
jgi:hypothetical protein